MSTSPAELSSLTTAIEDITKRVGQMADGYSSARREDLAGELYAVERQLGNVIRRLTKVVAAQA